VDAARKQWWIGLREAEAVEYRGEGLDFERDESTYREGFEAALVVLARGAGERGAVKLLQERYPSTYRTTAFRRGYERDAPTANGSTRARVERPRRRLSAC
jgi:hypothetical protein